MDDTQKYNDTGQRMGHRNKQGHANEEVWAKINTGHIPEKLLGTPVC